MSFDAEAAYRYSISDDRDTAPFFAGRAGEIRHFDEALSMIGDRGDAALFRIYQGAPGAGKTSLLNHLMANSTDDVAFLPLRPDDLTSKAALDACVLAGLSAVVERGMRLAAEVGSALAKRFDLDGIVDTSRKALVERAGTTKKVVLYMDEAQIVEPNCATGLTELHTRGLGFPSMTLLFGLSHTTKRLAAAGLSRLSRQAVRTMGKLSDEECEQSTAAMLEAFGVSGNSEQATERVARLSFGWPQHLFGAQQALCAALTACDGDVDRVDWDGVRRESDRIRYQYYEGRLEASVLDVDHFLTAKIVAGIRAGKARRFVDLEGLCADELHRSGRSGHSAFAGGGAAFQQALFEKGVVSVSDTGACELTIPSMGDWMTERFLEG